MPLLTLLAGVIQRLVHNVSDFFFETYLFLLPEFVNCFLHSMAKSWWCSF